MSIYNTTGMFRASVLGKNYKYDSCKVTPLKGSAPLIKQQRKTPHEAYGVFAYFSATSTPSRIAQQRRLNFGPSLAGDLRKSCSAPLVPTYIYHWYYNIIVLYWCTSYYYFKKRRRSTHCREWWQRRECLAPSTLCQSTSPDYGLRATMSRAWQALI